MTFDDLLAIITSNFENAYAASPDTRARHLLRDLEAQGWRVVRWVVPPASEAGADDETDGL